MAEMSNLNRTCSMQELGGMSDYDTPAHYKKIIRETGTQAAIANTCSKSVGKNLKAAGFKLVGTYRGRDAPTVYVYMKGLYGKAVSKKVPAKKTIKK